MITPVGICPSNASRTVFERQGFLGPLPVLTTWQCELLVRHLNRGAHVAPAVWEKGRAISDYLFYDIATQPEILGILRLLLGENIILWGASVQSRQPASKFIRGILISRRPAQTCARLPFGSALRIRARSLHFT